MPFRNSFLLPLALTVATGLAACEGCHGHRSETPKKAPTPSVRLYLFSSMAGALEPCGCSKHQLGGLNHLAAFITKEKATAPNFVTASAGPLFFLNPKSEKDHANQDEWKAVAISQGLAKLGFVGWAPGANDWNAGGAKLKTFASTSQGQPLAANFATSVAGSVKVKITKVGGYAVGFVGISVPKFKGLLPKAVVLNANAEALQAGIKQAKAKGAQVLVGLMAAPRGDALRLMDNVKGLNVLVVGKSYDEGEGNDKPAPPQLINDTLVVQGANHLQSVAVVDLFLDGKAVGKIHDAAGIANGEQRASLEGRIRDLKARLVKWENNKSISKKDLADRRADLAKLEKELKTLSNPKAPSSGSFFRYRMVDVDDTLGSDKGLEGVMAGFYKRVNAHNKEAFKDRKPPPVPEGRAGYVGIKQCALCHQEEMTSWSQTPHARAYQTLVDGHKEYNLDCVSCHVTGYEKPGGSTVTANALLQNVQCEQCHGPGSLHKANPSKKGLIMRSPPPSMCTESCHHPPHVEGFSPKAHAAVILGKGHGNPATWGK